MRFWQKAFLCTIVVFLVAFDLVTFLLVKKSYSLNRENIYALAENERNIIQKSLYERLFNISGYYADLNADNLKMYVSPYGAYYKDQKIYMELYKGNVPVYSNFPHTMEGSSKNLPENSIGNSTGNSMEGRPELDIEPGQKSTVERTVGGISYLFITGYLGEPFSDLKFVYIKDIQDLTDYRNKMLNYAVVISVIVSGILSVLIIAMLLKLTAPIRKLNRTAKEIADGHYQKRVEVKSRDEIGEFASNFNAMADSVEAHIRKLSELTEERQRFINNLAHEMRTPVTAIIGYAEFLKCANYSREEGIKAIDYIIHQGERMKNMASKLLDLSRLNNADIELETVDVGEIIENVEQTLMQSINEKKVNITKDLQVTEIEGDKDLMESFMQNVIENAVRALPAGGKVEIKTYDNGKESILSVSDNGMGMSEDELKKIFEPFYRVDKSRSRAYGGAGLGLALCKRICELHNAEMNITSKPGAGTRVEAKFQKQ